jgi:hypothetical protein
MKPISSAAQAAFSLAGYHSPVRRKEAEMLGLFVIRLLAFCFMMLLAAWVADALASRPRRNEPDRDPEPYGGDAWFAHRFHG